MSCNLVDVLARRCDSNSTQYRESIDAILEKQFIQSHDFFDYDLIPDMVLSTIAIALSPNGALVASTHGDHTVKIFQHETGYLIHSFHGHPRTPWTVKFHPSDANYVASGCLGCEVRVWDIRNRICRSKIKLSYSIISLSFQPNGGAHIGIASGPQLLLWDWKSSASPEEDDVMYRNGQGNQPAYPNQVIEPVLEHSRNIRAVIFHPIGTLAFAAAPDPPRQANAAPSPCRLYVCECPLLGNRNNVRRKDIVHTTPPPLDSMPTLIPQIHLYSDGGLDISADGHYIFACAMLAIQQVPMNRLVRSPPMPLPGFSDSNINNNPDRMRRYPSDDSSHGSTSSFTTSSDNGIEEHGINNNVGEERNDVSQLGHAFDSLSLLQRDNDNCSHFRRINPTISMTNMSDILGKKYKLVPLKKYVITRSQENESHPNRGSFLSYGRSNVIADEWISSMTTDGNHLMFLADPTNSCPQDWSVEERLCLFKINLNLNEETAIYSGNISPKNTTVEHSLYDPKTVTVTDSFNDDENSNHVNDKHERLESSSSLQYNDLATSQDPYAIRIGDKVELRNHKKTTDDSRVDEDTLPNMQPRCVPSVDLVQSRQLPGSLMRAVTSMKLSPSGRLGLIGYGVRVYNNVLHHENEKVACEILDLTSNMSTSCIMTDDIDEVNIAQFHPFPGLGVLYGTKRGKVRVFLTKHRDL